MSSYSFYTDFFPFCQGLASVGQDIKLDNRVLDLRTATNQAIFRVEGGIMKYFRDALTEEGFVEINSPKIISGKVFPRPKIFPLIADCFCHFVPEI